MSRGTSYSSSTKTDGTNRKDPRSAWPDKPWIGVVRIKSEDVTVITVGGQNHQVPTVTDVEYEVGNTVEAGDVQGWFEYFQKHPLV